MERREEGEGRGGEGLEGSEWEGLEGSEGRGRGDK